jgi:hypothetical protein
VLRGGTRASTLGAHIGCSSSNATSEQTLQAKHRQPEIRGCDVCLAIRCVSRVRAQHVGGTLRMFRLRRKSINVLQIHPRRARVFLSLEIHGGSERIRIGVDAKEAPCTRTLDERRQNLNRTPA